MNPDILKLRQIGAYWESRIFMTAIELGLFTTLGKTWASGEDVARKLNASERGTGILLRALTAMELVEHDNGRYRNGDLVNTYLNASNDSYRGGSFLHLAHLWHRWSDLTEIVRSGVLPPDREQRNEQQYHDFILAMHHNKIDHVRAKVPSFDLEGTKRLLDLGGGSGVISLAITEHHPEITCVVFDLAPALKVARKVLPEDLLDDRILLQEGDFYTDDLGSGYDRVMVSAIIHMMGPDEIKMLFSKIHGAIKPGGKLILRDFFLNDEKTEPRFGAVFAVNMLVNTENGDSYSFEETRGWLLETGFTNPVLKEFEQDPETMIIAEK
jgi:ubiquinone/menaquinone biosynthesis C-methylase UbiE